MMLSERLFRATIVVLIFIVAFDVASANDTFVHISGYAAYPIKTDKIRMIAEKISVVMAGDGTGRAANVQCEFEFENATNKEVRATIGFPAEDRYYYDYPDGGEPDPPLRDFASFVDDVEAKVSIRKHDEDKGWRGIYWYTWDVVFPPAQRKKLRNVYKAPLSNSYYNHWFTYILTTGANWKGPIGHSVIEVAYESAKDLKRRVRAASPDGFKIRGNKIVWEYQDFVPQKNIEVHEVNLDRDGNITDVTGTLMGGLVETYRATRYEGDSRLYTEMDLNIRSKQTLMSAVRSLAKEYTGNVKSEEQFINEVNLMYLRLLRNQIYAKRGRYFNSEYLRSFFMKVGGYTSGPDYSDSLLNTTERKNIDLIASYESKLARY